MAQLAPLVPPKPGQDATLAKLFRGLGDPTRVRILTLLQDREMTVSELMSILKLQQGRVSSHLACLRWCGLVEVRRSDRHAYYRVGDRRARQIVALARSFLDDNEESIELCRTMEPPASVARSGPASRRRRGGANGSGRGARRSTAARRASRAG
jgi:DNA-binding transcriptional ArsR family regulator